MVGTYTGLADVGVVTMTECLTIAGWIAQSVRFPVMVDGDTGHGGIMAVRRLIAESIRAGLTDHVWTLREVLLFRVPPWPQPAGL